MAFTEDFDEFFSTDDFSVAVTTSDGVIDCIFDREYVELQNIQGAAPVLYCATSDVSSVVDGDTFTIGDNTYYQIKQEFDGTGITKVILREA